MNKSNSCQRFAVLLFCLCVLFQGEAWGKTRPVAAVIAGSGSLQVRRAGAANPVPLALRAPLFTGDVISTGPNGRAKVLFNDGSQVKMRAGTRLQIMAPAAPQSGTNLFLALAGEIWARLRPGRSVKTVYTNLVVRGTEFNLLVAGHNATVTVIEGEVGFSNRFGQVAVGVSQQSLATRDAAPTQPVTIANPGLIIEWTLDVENVAFPLDKSFGGPRDAALSAADALFESGKYELALASYQQGGGAPALRLRSGYALLKLGRLDEAEAAFRALAALPGNEAEALTGLAWTELKRNRFALAQTAAEQALAAPGGAALVEPHLVLGVALLRQNKATEAETQLRAALTANPPEQRYQARAWLALLHLARSQNDEALKEARLAVQAAPNSSLAQVSLATVGFFAGETSEASRAAKRAAALSPDDMAVQLALGQAKLAQGDVDGAASAAARATALDPQWPQAHYLLGVADAGRRDWRHAEGSLKKTLEIAPEFFPATAALARVYVKMGREKQGLALLDDYEKAHGENNLTLAARGEVFYTLARYDDAMQAYRKALALRSDSAASWNGLARVAIDANHLSEAIDAGQKAVQLASQISEYHATLGLAYQFSRLDTQAERSFRTALALDPSNALSLVQLGLKNKEGDARTQGRTSALTFVQGFIFDPAISRDLLRGGISNEITPGGGPKNLNLGIEHRTVADDGNLNVYGRYVNSKDDGDRANSDLKNTSLRQDTTYVAGKRTNVYFHLQRNKFGGGLPGKELNAVGDDRNHFSLNQGILAVRQRTSSRGYLWLGAFANGQSEARTNPDHDQSLVHLFGSGPTGPNGTISLQDLLTRSRALNPELRFDYRLPANSKRPGTLSFGAANLRQKRQAISNIFAPNSFPPNAPPTTGQIVTRQEALTSLAYAQWQQTANAKLSFVAQLRSQHARRKFSSRGNVGGIVLNTPEKETTKNLVLPSLIANYLVDAKTTLRFFANRRITDPTSSIFAPVDTLLTTEEQSLPLGLPDAGRNGDLSVLELDAERRISSGSLLKLFVFHSTGRNINYDFSNLTNPSDFEFSGNSIGNALGLDRVQRKGVGMRYEQRLSRSLFGQAHFALNRTTAESMISYYDFTKFMPVTVPAIFNGQTAPYHPKVNASLGLNYLDPRGIKAKIELNYRGSFFADTGEINAVTRPRFPAKTTVDVLLAHEPSVRSEVFLAVTNLFNARQIVFNAIPVGGRRILIGATLRFR